MLLKKLVIKYLRDLKLKNCNEGLKKNSRRTLETNFTFKRANLLLALVSKQILTNGNAQSRSFRKQRSSK